MVKEFAAWADALIFQKVCSFRAFKQKHLKAEFQSEIAIYGTQPYVISIYSLKNGEHRSPSGKKTTIYISEQLNFKEN